MAPCYLRTSLLLPVSFFCDCYKVQSSGMRLGHPTSPTLDIDRYGKDKWGNGTAKEWKDKGAQRLKGSWKEGKGPSHCE